MVQTTSRSSFLRLGKDPIQTFLYLAGGALLLYVLVVALGNVAAGRYGLRDFLQGIVLGLAQGSIYALIALGYTLVYGVLRMINFAHSEVFMAGAYIGFFAINAFSQTPESGGPSFLEQNTVLALLLTIIVGMTASSIIAVLLERIAYRPLRRAPRLVSLITAIGVSITLQQLFLRLFGGGTRSYPVVNLCFEPLQVPDQVDRVCGTAMNLLQGRYRLPIGEQEIIVRPLYFIVFAIALVLMTTMWFIVQRTKVGKAMRAVAEDKNTASLMGINVDRIIVVTFLLGATLAGAAAVMFAVYNPQVTPFMGFFPGVKAFTAAVLGGIGNIPGAMAGGLLLGIIESAAPGMLGIPSQLEDVVAFSVLVLIMIFRPSGIFGEALTKSRA
ncbi:MAG: branched-chain amino acid ABC transporter permease [Anaerolineae bacterium]|jgi:branched-chain amino acid transport system permease protein|nr:branched-chain amino acid ABC transporter permease [Anaerolineae bacterium]